MIRVIKLTTRRFSIEKLEQAGITARLISLK